MDNDPPAAVFCVPFNEERRALVGHVPECFQPVPRHSYQLPLAPPPVPSDGLGGGAAASGDECPSDPGPLAFKVPASLTASCACLTTSRSADPASTTIFASP